MAKKLGGPRGAVQFKDVKAVVVSGRRFGMVCGEVNGLRFIANNGTRAVDIENSIHQDSDFLFNRVWVACQENRDD